MNPSRLTIVKKFYYQPQGEQPVSAGDVRFSRPLDTSEQLYERAITVGTEWQAITAWFSEASHIVLHNREGERLQAIPTAEERADIAARVVEIGVVGADGVPIPFALARPGAAEDFAVVALASLRLRCRASTAKCWLTVVPT